MYQDVIPLVLIIAALIIYLWYRLSGHPQCPRCQGRSRKLKISVGYRLTGGSRKKAVQAIGRECRRCGNMWTTRDVHFRTAGIVIPSKTEFRR